MRRLGVAFILFAIALAVLVGLSYYSVDRGLYAYVTATDFSFSGVVVHLNVSNNGFIPVTVGSVAVSMYTSDGLLVCEGSRVVDETLSPGEFTVTAVECRLTTGVKGLLDVLFAGPILHFKVKLKADVGPLGFEKELEAAR